MSGGIRACFTEVGGLRTRYLRAGEGPLVLLVHPVGYPAEIFARNIEALATRCTVLAPDLPGQGFSEPPLTWDGAPQVFMMRQLRELVRQLGFASYTTVGSSLGGLVAALLALHDAERVKGLVVLGSGSVFNDPAGQPAVLQQVYANGSTVHENPDTLTCRRRLDNTCFQRRPADDIILSQLTAYALPGAQQAYRSILDGLSRSMADPAATVYPHLERIAAPALVVVGRDDSRTSIDSHARGVARMQRARLEVFDACGHLPFFEHPQRFNELLLDFISP